ncbi:hypothetical protein V6N13_123955 [Hibiscus sabdariffa]|uniref:Uncharacterized protein n=1 Tax=Hibiscus sabdariffa TaxID=183260 RepID=A0ABR2B3N2_9ROSI
MAAVIETPFLATTAPLGTIHAMEPKLDAATIPIAPAVAISNTPQLAGMIPSKAVNAESTTAPTTPVDANINVPVVAVFDPQSTGPFANPNETTNDVPYLLDNMGLDVVTTTFLRIPREGGLENDMGKSFLATSYMLLVFDD